MGHSQGCEATRENAWKAFSTVLSEGRPGGALRTLKGPARQPRLSPSAPAPAPTLRLRRPRPETTGSTSGVQQGGRGTDFVWKTEFQGHGDSALSLGVVCHGRVVVGRRCFPGQWGPEPGVCWGLMGPATRKGSPLASGEKEETWVAVTGVGGSTRAVTVRRWSPTVTHPNPSAATVLCVLREATLSPGPP